ncbi:YmfQ family protein [Anoxybacillus gonensis]|uniref:YmfQ family protein n=1 Tax=Anoxybacillus gonensis TaxID=198467 RepID=UPI0002C021D3|nr:YmfQ family protein [Anoxybacillus gonensis]EMI10360.1 phage-like element pbsx protein XkdT [Anoxybacillus gonensis]
MRILGTDIERDIERNMFSYIPQDYWIYRESREIIKAEASELESLNAAIGDVLAQFFIDTATWGLSHWERICGIPIDESKPVEQRRSVIKSKLRGIGTVTVALIKNVAESWYNGEVEVTEQPSLYTVKIKFVSKLGVPPNLADIQNALREIIPAHLAIDFEFSYLLIKDVHNVMTLSQLEATTLDKFAGGA